MGETGWATVVDLPFPPHFLKAQGTAFLAVQLQAELCFSKDIQDSVHKGVSELLSLPALLRCSDAALLALTAH